MSEKSNVVGKEKFEMRIAVIQAMKALEKAKALLAEFKKLKEGKPSE